MSANEETDSETTESTSDATDDAGPGTREVAYRLFATEFEDSELSYSESDEERAPNYVVTPTGLRLNRLFAVGVLTEVERINTDTLRGRIVDPTGAFVTYAGQYQPEAQAFLDGADSPSFVAITGKARTFEPEDSDRIFTSVRPESLSEVDADTRDRWTVSAAEATLERIAVVAAAIESDLRGDELRAALETTGVDAPLAAGIPRALDYYGTTTAYLEAIQQCAVDALEVVAGEREEVRPVDVAPDDGGTATLGPLPDVDIELSADASDSVATPEETGAASTTPEETGSASTTPDEPESSSTTPDTSTAVDETAGDETADEPAEPAETTTSATTESTDAPATPDADADTTTSPESTTESPATETADDPQPTAGSDESSTTDPATEATPESTETETTEGSEPAATDDVDDAEMYQLDDEEREEIESEFGADFSSGNEVDPAGEADIDVPDADELAAEVEDDNAPANRGGVESTSDAAEPATSEPTETTESDDSTESLGSFEDTIDDTDESATEADAEPAGTTSESTASTDAASDADAVDLEDAAVELMADLDDGDGADREAVVDAVVDAHGAERAAVEDAIDDALMGGRCYEPDDGTLKPI
ncbi:hypothetical protein HKK80_00870 [Halonotius sp. F2-221B]|uniref:hypothetical protein n=1 Tax=Halonotius sp. F2-221B TaxID=2731620 RepID=UPI00398A7E38